MRWGRDFDADPPPVGIASLRIYKWGRAAAGISTQRQMADLHPRYDEHEPLLRDLCCKVYEEVPSDNPASGRRELLIECKIALVLEAWAGWRYYAHLFPLRGTDWWPVLSLLRAEMGDPETMIHDGEDGVIVWFSSARPAAPRSETAEPGEVHDTSRHSGWEDRISSRGH